MTGVPAPAGPTARFVVGDTRQRTVELGDDSVDLVVTSPPFLALRSYLPADHPDKSKEVGSEATPAEFLDTLLDLTAEWGRVLAPYGSIAVELGDTYAGSGGAGGDYNPGGVRQGQNGFTGSSARSRHEQPRQWSGGTGWPLEKSLCGIPTLYAWSLAYGRNLLTGEASPAGQWRIRNLVAWVRPNPPVGALADKFRPATSYITIATKARDRWFDLDAVRQPLAAKTLTVADGTPPSAKNNGSPSGHHRQDRLNNPAGAPPLDWWEIVPGGYPGAHYAVYPPELPKRLIEAMCPRRVCATCGQPSRRLHEQNPEYVGRAGGQTHNNDQQGASLQGFPHEAYPPTKWVPAGWSTCDCIGADGLRLDGYHTGPGWRPGHVLDPFAGSGTTLAAATGLSRAATGIDLDERNADLARNRVGMFLEVLDLFQEAPSG